MQKHARITLPWWSSNVVTRSPAPVTGVIRMASATSNV
jgi:hypothetical protein